MVKTKHKRLAAEKEKEKKAKIETEVYIIKDNNNIVNTDSWNSTSFVLSFLISAFFGYFFGKVLYNKTIWHWRYDTLTDEESWATIRTENAFYYAFYDDVVKAPTMWEGILKCFWRDDFEYPDMLNAFERLNIAPELFAGVLFRLIQPDLIPMNFYIVIRNCCYGFGLFGLSFGGYLISNSVFGCLMSCVLFLFLSFLTQRLGAQPCLRENWALGFFYLQYCCVYYVLCTKKKLFYSLSFWFVSLIFVLFWQFSQFMFANQIMTIIGMHAIRVISTEKAIEYFKLSICVLISSWICLMGNEFISHSLWTWCVFGALATVSVSKYLKLPSKNSNWMKQIIFEAFGFIFFTVVMKKIQDFIWPSEIEAGGHIAQFILEKFGLEKWMGPLNMHTLMYATQNVFMTPSLKQQEHFTKSGLLPLGIIASILLFIAFFRSAYQNKLEKINPFWVYVFVQTAGNCVIFVLIQRFQVLFVPCCILLACLVFNSKIWKHSVSFSLPIFVKPVIFAIVCSFAWKYESSELLKTWWERQSGPDREAINMFRWVRNNLDEDAVFGSNIAICGDMFLGTKRKVVVHPQYESAKLRKRYESISKINGHRPLKEVWKIYRAHNVTHVPVYWQACFGQTSRPGVTMSHVIESLNQTQIKKYPKTACSQLVYPNKYFKFIWASEKRWIWEVRDKALKKKPKRTDYYGDLESGSICRFLKYYTENMGKSATDLIKIVQQRPQDPECACIQARKLEHSNPKLAWEKYEEGWEKTQNIECLNNYAYFMDVTLAREEGAGAARSNKLRFKAAAKCFKRAISDFSEEGHIHYNYAFHLGERGKMKKAVKHFEKAISRISAEDDHLCNYARFISRSKYKKRIPRLLKKILIQNPNNVCLDSFKHLTKDFPKHSNFLILKYYLGLWP